MTEKAIFSKDTYVADSIIDKVPTWSDYRPMSASTAGQVDGRVDGEWCMPWREATTFGAFVPVEGGGFRPVTPEISGAEVEGYDPVKTAIGGTATGRYSGVVNVFRGPAST